MKRQRLNMLSKQSVSLLLYFLVLQTFSSPQQSVELRNLKQHHQCKLKLRQCDHLKQSQQIPPETTCSTQTDIESSLSWSKLNQVERSSTTQMQCQVYEFWDSSHHLCLRCSDYHSGCLYCLEEHDQLRCLQCYIPYYALNQSHQCQKCSGSVPHCQHCTKIRHQMICNTCEEGFYHSQTSNQCLQCPKTCLLCNSSLSSLSNDISCFDCAEGFVLYGGKCVAGYSNLEKLLFLSLLALSILLIYIATAIIKRINKLSEALAKNKVMIIRVPQRFEVDHRLVWDISDIVRRQDPQEETVSWLNETDPNML